MIFHSISTERLIHVRSFQSKKDYVDIIKKGKRGERCATERRRVEGNLFLPQEIEERAELEVLVKGYLKTALAKRGKSGRRKNSFKK